MPDISMCHTKTPEMEVCRNCVRNDKNTEPNPLYQSFLNFEDTWFDEVKLTNKCEMQMYKDFSK